jgi:hypothetical protein
MAELSKSGKRLIIPVEVWVYKGKEDIQFTAGCSLGTTLLTRTR